MSDRGVVLFAIAVESRKKRGAGCQALIIVALPMAALIYWGEMDSGPSRKSAVPWTALRHSFPLWLRQSLPPINDNTRVSLRATLMLLVTQTLFMGCGNRVDRIGESKWLDKRSSAMRRNSNCRSGHPAFR